MAKIIVKIVLSKDKKAGDKVIRKQGFVLLEGTCSAGVTPDEVNKAIQLNEARVIALEEKKEEKPK